MSNEPIYRTAPATLGLLKVLESGINCLSLKEKTKSYVSTHCASTLCGLRGSIFCIALHCLPSGLDST